MKFSRLIFVAFCCVLSLTLSADHANAQFGGGGFGGGGFGGGGNGGGGGFGGGGGGFGGGGFGGGGILIDGDGVVQLARVSNKLSVGTIKKKMSAAAEKFLAQDMNRPSELRMVSLRQLEAECVRVAKSGDAVPPQLRFVAGLQRIDYVFVDADAQDIIIAGPADGFAPNQIGRVVGLTTGRPPIHLDDLLVALRTNVRGMVGCSIDPEPERLAAMNRWVRANSNPVSTAIAHRRYGEMARILGKQNISVWGVPEDSHFALTLVEADYRMKLIASGLERPRVRGLTSHLALTRPGTNSIQRWWFAPLYDSIERSADSKVWHFTGQRAQLLAQEELADAQGNRSAAPDTRLSVRKFAQQFTDKFPALTDTAPVFAELQNLFDLIVLNALIRNQLANLAGWQPQELLDVDLLPTRIYHVPKTVQSVANTKKAGRVVIGLVTGGVKIRADVLARKTKEAEEALPKLAQASDAGAWWWDAAPGTVPAQPKTRRSKR